MFDRGGELEKLVGRSALGAEAEIDLLRPEAFMHQHSYCDCIFLHWDAICMSNCEGLARSTCYVQPTNCFF